MGGSADYFLDFCLSFLKGRQSTGLAGYMGWVRKLFCRLLPEFLVVEVVHGVGEKHWVGAKFIVKAFV